MKQNKSNTSHSLHKNILIAVFLFSLILLSTFLVFLYHQDQKIILHSAQETISFLKGSCTRYDNYHTAEEANTMQELTDDAQILNKYISDDMLIDDSFLKNYASTEHLSGVLIVDGNLEPIAQTDCDGLNAYSLWAEIISNSTRANILKYSKKTYSDIVKLGKKDYAVAMIGRTDQPGIILCYQNMTK